jgi:type IV pilus assembly protein PilM
MVRIAKEKPLPIGLDLGTGSIRMAQLQAFSDDRVVLLAARSATIPLEIRKDPRARLNFAGKTIRDVLKSGEFHGQQCVMSLPAEAVCLQHVRIPKVPPEETAQAVMQELEGKVPFPLGSAEVRHVVAGEVAGEEPKKQEVIAVATPRATLEAYLDMARRARLDVIGVNVECCAVVECFGRLFRRGEDAERTVLFVDSGAASTQVVLSKGNQLAFARNLTMGGQQLEQAIAEKINVSPDEAARMRRQQQREQEMPVQQTPEPPMPQQPTAEQQMPQPPTAQQPAPQPPTVQQPASQPPTEQQPAPQPPTAQQTTEQNLHEHMGEPLQNMADELTQCLRYYESVFRNQSVERAIFVGGQAYDKALCQSLAKRLNLPAQIGDPLLRIERSPVADAALEQRQPQPDWAVAVGLSLGAATAA